MQAKNNDGTYGEVRPFDKDGLEELLRNPNVEKVEVFKATEEELERRLNCFSVKKRFQKVPKIKKR